MKIGLYGTDINILQEWQSRLNEEATVLENADALFDEALDIVMVDYNTVYNEINALNTKGTTPAHLVVLESNPADATGKLLILNGAMAYGNSRMLKIHLDQLVQTVMNNKIWVYPDLMNSIIKTFHISENLDPTLMKRLTNQEIEVTKLILHALSNEAIATKLNITQRTVKAHISSIFSKLHVNDRVSLVLLLNK